MDYKLNQPTTNISTIIIILFMLSGFWLQSYLYSKEQKALLGRKIEVIIRLNVYNEAVLRSFKEIIDEKKYDRFFFINFSTPMYRQNMDVLHPLPEVCKNAYLYLIGHMEGVNIINGSILEVANQQILVYNSAQAQNTQNRKDFLYEQLEKAIKEVEHGFKAIKSCY